MERKTVWVEVKNFDSLRLSGANVEAFDLDVFQGEIPNALTSVSVPIRWIAETLRKGRMLICIPIV